MATDPITGAPYLGPNDAPDLAGITKAIADWSAGGRVLLEAVDEAERNALFANVPAPALCASKDRKALWFKATDDAGSAAWRTVYEEPSDPVGWFAPAAGWDAAAANLRVDGRTCHAYIRAIRTGAAIGGVSSGDIANTAIGTVAAEYAPVQPASGSSNASGTMVGAGIWTDGGVFIAAMPPNVGIATNAQVSFSLVWLRA